MATMPSKQELKRMISMAMQNAAPAMYRQLKATGKLDQVLTDRAEEAVQAYSVMVSQAEAKVEQHPTLAEQMQESDRAKRVATEIAISQATEFQTDQSPSEPTEA